MLPDGNAGFELVDQPLRRRESSPAMGRTHPQKERGLRHRHKADPMMEDQLENGEPGGRLRREEFELVARHRGVRLVIEPGDFPRLLLPPDDAVKIQHRARLVRENRGPRLEGNGREANFWGRFDHYGFAGCARAAILQVPDS
jgi:hypothetical protein